MNEREIRIAQSVMQLKAEPFCIECGGTGFVVFGEFAEKDTSNIWTACTMCGSEMLWGATPNHQEMLQRIVELTTEQKGLVIEQYEYICNKDGSCAGVCGGICREHWSINDLVQKTDNSSDDHTANIVIP